MHEYLYRAARSDGHMVQGSIKAESRDAALQQLRMRLLTPLELSEQGLSGSGNAGRGFSWSFLGKRDRAPGFKEVHKFAGEMAIMLRAGLPMDRALSTLVKMTPAPGMRTLLEDLLTSVKAGKSFSQALQQHQELFGDFFVNMVRAGEASGRLGDALASLEEHLERLRALRESVISALIYPAILLVVATISVVLMLGYVVPQFESLFDDMGEALPLPTQVVLALGQGVDEWGWVLAILIAGAALFLRTWLRRDSGARWWARVQLSMPLVGEALRKFEITRFTRSMGTLLKNGVPIVTSIRIAADTIGNEVLRASISGISPAVKQGRRLGDALEESDLLTPLALNMVRLGEETGRLDAMLLEVARVHDAEVQDQVKRGLVLLEPILILFLGGVIALIIIAILMGILSVNELAL